MQLYYATGTCSLAPHIVAEEAGIALEPVRVDLKAAPHRLDDGSDYTTVNPKGYVPALRLDDGALLTEGVAIMLHLGRLAPQSGLVPRDGSREGDQHQEWLTFISSELHKMYSPWLFHPEYGEQAAQVARDRIAERLALVDAHLADRQTLVGDTFTAADAYLFTIVGWSKFARVDLSPFPSLRRFMKETATRPAVRSAMAAQGLPVEAAA